MPDSPALNAIGNKTVTKDSLLKFTVKATDADKGQTITYTLIDAPAGATVNTTSGVFKWTHATAGTYKCKIRAADNDTPSLYDEEQITVTVTMPAALGAAATSLNEHLHVNVFPNPADDILNISISNPVNRVLISIFDLKGSLVSSNTISMNGYIAQLNVSTLPRGFYILQLQTDLYTR